MSRIFAVKHPSLGLRCSYEQGGTIQGSSQQRWQDVETSRRRARWECTILSRETLAFQQVNWVSREMNSRSFHSYRAVPYNEAGNSGWCNVEKGGFQKCIISPTERDRTSIANQQVEVPSHRIASAIV